MPNGFGWPLKKKRHVRIYSTYKSHRASCSGVPTTPTIPQQSAVLSSIIPVATAPAAVTPARIFIQATGFSCS